MSVAEIRSAVSDKQHHQNQQQNHPTLFKGLGCLDGKYGIQIDTSVAPFNLTTPCQVVTPQLPCVNAELLQMEDLDMIEKIDEPSAWCSPMVVIAKSNGKVSLAVVPLEASVTPV